MEFVITRLTSAVDYKAYCATRSTLSAVSEAGNTPGFSSPPSVRSATLGGAQVAATALAGERVRCAAFNVSTARPDAAAVMEGTGALGVVPTSQVRPYIAYLHVTPSRVLTCYVTHAGLPG